MTATAPVTPPDPSSEEMKQLIAEAANLTAGRPAPPVEPARPDLLSAEQVESWTRDGFFILRGALDAAETADVHDEAVAAIRHLAETGDEFSGYRSGDGMFSVPEPNLIRASDDAPDVVEDHVSKLFNLHRRGAFERFARHPELLAVLRGLLGERVDCFNSQYIFKNPGAWGQPWHQDSLYFSFDRFPQVGLWLATSPATHDNGCLFVAPGSHTEPLHHHVPDRRDGANLGYLEIIDHDFANAVAVEMDPGDVLVFHSFLMHCSGDNRSTDRRTALVHHFAATGTEVVGEASGTIDFMTVSG